MDDIPLRLNNEKWEEAIPSPYYYSFFQWLWKRFTGWRDEYGRKAELFWDGWW